MGVPVILTDAADSDLDELYDYIARHDSRERARQVLTRIDKAITSLAESPERGTVPAEMSLLGILSYREVFFKPYRIVYQVLPEFVLVLLIADGRRDLQTLLQRRLLDA